MPSPKAVLRDIHDLKLDPTKAHRGVKASGRLAGQKVDVVADEPAPKVKPALVRLPDPEPEPVKVSEPEVVEPVAVAEEPAPKKAPPKKKDKPAKKDEPEEPPVS